MSENELMPAGWYYVGDLCYVMHDVWQEVCDLTFPPDRKTGRGLEGIFTLKDGRKFAIFGTAYGDGVYLDEDGEEYGVDSGTLGCILKDDIVEGHDNDRTLGHTWAFQLDFKVGNDGGVIRFGRTVIDTLY